MASAALATLKLPGRPVWTRSSVPSRCRSTKSVPSPRGAVRTTVQSAVRQSASPARLPSVRPWRGSSPGFRRRPQASGPTSSSTVTTAARARSGVKSRALVWKYSSMVPCRSRWSWVRLVKPATSNTTPSTRWKDTACEETSMEAASSPRSRMSASRACTSVDSGVVSRLGIGSPPARISMVPISPVRLAQRPQQGIDEVGGGGLAVGARHAEQGRRPGAVGPALVDQGGQPADQRCAARRPAAPGRGCHWRAPAGARRRRPSAPPRRRPRRPGTRSRPRAVWRPAGPRTGPPGGPTGSSGRSR